MESSTQAKTATMAGLIAALATTASFAASNLVAGLLRNKGLAVMLAPGGFGQWSQLMSFFYLVQTAAILGVTTGVSRYVAEYRRNGQDAAAVVTNALLLVGGVGLFLGGAIAAFSPWIATWVVDEPSWWWVVALVGLTVPVVAVQSIFQAGLQGVEDYKRLALTSIASAGAGLALALGAAWILGARGVAFFILGSFAVTALLYGRALRHHVKLRWRLKVDWKLARGIMSYGGVALLGSVFAAGATLAVRSVLLHAHGPDANGYYQAMSGLTLQILPVFLGGISLYVIPKLGGSDDRAYAGDVLARVIRIILLVVTPALALGVVFREAFFQILFSSAFLQAAGWFPVQLTGDLFLALAWAAGSHLLPMGKLRAFLFCELVRAFLMFTLGAGLLRAGVDPLGIGALAIAHGASYAAEAVLFLWIARRDVGLRLGQFTPVFAASALAWCAVLWAGYTLQPGWRLVAWCMATLFLWGIGVTRQEREKLTALLTRRRAEAR